MIDSQPLQTYDQIMDAIKKLSDDNWRHYRQREAIRRREMFYVIRGGRHDP